MMYYSSRLILIIRIQVAMNCNAVSHYKFIKMTKQEIDTEREREMDVSLAFCLSSVGVQPVSALQNDVAFQPVPRTITVVSDTNLVPLLAMYGLKHASLRLPSPRKRKAA